MRAIAPARDRAILYATGFLRAVATGMVGVLLGLHLAGLGLPPAAVGAVISAGHAGAALATLLVTVVGDRVARRTWLVGLALVGATGTLAAAVAATPGLLLLAAAVGMVNGMGRDRGAALVVEQAALPGATSDRQRTTVFAWAAVLQDAGHALGGLAAALPAWLAASPAQAADAQRPALLVAGMLIGATGLLSLGLSPAIEPRGASTASARLGPASRRIIARISALFALDSIAGGFLTTALVALFLAERFGVDAAALGALFFAARVANGGSHLLAAWLARRIGLVNTMVFTHLPSSLLLLTIPWAPSFPVAAALFLLREGLVEMDVPTRQSYVMAVVEPGERTRAAGITNLVRLAGWAVAPVLAGTLMQAVAPGGPLVVAAAMKIVYDVLLYRSFRHVRPPEERTPQDVPHGPS